MTEKIVCKYCYLYKNCDHNYDYVCIEFEKNLTLEIIERFLMKQEAGKE